MKKKSLTVLIALALTFGLFAGLMPTANAAGMVCEIAGWGQFDNLDDALSTVKHTGVIKLLADIKYNGGIQIESRTVNFDLNGKKLEIMNPSGAALVVTDGGVLDLVDPLNGEFLVAGYLSVVAEQDSKATVTNVGTIGGISVAITALEPGSEVIVAGNVWAQDYGVTVSNGGKVRIDGALINTGGAAYVTIGVK